MAIAGCKAEGGAVCRARCLKVCTCSNQRYQLLCAAVGSCKLDCCGLAQAVTSTDGSMDVRDRLQQQLHYGS